MQAISQKEIIALVSDINAFADQAEKLINSTQNAYQAEKEKMARGHSSEVSGLDGSYRANCDAVRKKSQDTVQQARNILKSIERLDVKLANVDKYYVKTKKKKEAALAGKTSEAYSGATDYFATLDKIQASFRVLFKKYSEDILPGLINGLNYLFSSQRKKDYEELIVLRNTVASFILEIERELPPITEESLSSLKADYFARRDAMAARHKREAEGLETRYSAALDDVAGKVCAALDAVLPDEFVDYLHDLIADYGQNIGKVNGAPAVRNGVLQMWFADYPVDYFVESKIVASIIKEKCAKLLTEGGAIRFPAVLSTADAPVWLIQSDGNNAAAVQGFTHAAMFGLLSSVPVSRLVYSVVDPENRGNSVSPFFDAKKKLPELFGEKIYISREDIAAKVARLNDKIEGILQDRLGNQYESVFAYAQENADYTAEAELLVLYDFPKGFDERTLAELRNILRNGGRCGIFTLIACSPETENERSNDYKKSVDAIRELSTGIVQNDRAFFFRGLSLSWFPMPDKAEFAKYFSKYMLIFEGIKNRGIAFSPLIKKLSETKDSLELDAHIDLICGMMRDYERDYAHVPGTKAVFPSTVILGNVLYPADIFSDSAGLPKILEKFGVGERGDDGVPGYVELPLTFDLQNSFNLFLNAPESSGREMLTFTHHVIWSVLSFMPVTKANICVFDAEQRGNSIIPFLDFRKKSPETFDQKIYTSDEAMTERLQRINAQIDEFIQEKLGNKYKNILDYNIHTPNRAEAVTLLVLYDFPSGMDGRGLDLLSNILRNGNKCGVFTIMCYNPNITFSRYESIDERLENLRRYCAMVEFKDRHYRLLPYNLQINLPEALDGAAADAFIREYAGRCEEIKKQGLSFRDILAEDLFSMDSSKALRIPVGVGDGDSIVELTIGEGSSHHGLIAGATGSGKSTLLHTLIMSSMLHYSPEQLNLYLMDFKSGTEFKIYESVKLPHIKLLALDAMQEFGESILENLVGEMERRGALFKGAGQTSLKGYTQATGQPLPRILVIMDEFQILFNDATNRKVAMNCAELTKRIVTEGRAFGIHLLMATQSTKVITDLTLSRGTIEQMRIRIGLKCGEDDARYLFSDQNDAKALSMMKGAIGTAVMNLDYTEQANIGFRVAYCDEDTQGEYLQKIAGAFSDQPYTLQIFEGGRTVRLLDYFRGGGIALTDESPVKIHMGSLIKVAPPFAVCMDKKRKHNLLVCGANERMAGMIAGNYMVSALLNRNATVYCIDGDYLVGDESSAPFYAALEGFGDRFRAARDRADIIRFINEAYGKYQAQKKQNSGEAVFMVIKNLQFLDIVKSMLKGDPVDESEFIDDEPVQEAEFNPADPFAAVNAMFAARKSDDHLGVGEKLIKMVEESSGLGIYFVVTSLEYQTVRETMYYGENVLSRFPERVIFSLGANDADNLIENVSVAGLRDNTVYYTDGVKNTFQLKPYITPEPDELKGFVDALL